jgi:hypothetical protein
MEFQPGPEQDRNFFKVSSFAENVAGAMAKSSRMKASILLTWTGVVLSSSDGESGEFEGVSESINLVIGGSIASPACYC